MADKRTLTDLETVLTWEGEIDNSRIRELLDVKPVWASRLLAELALRMGTRAKRETSHSPLKFIDKHANGSPDDYLRVIGSDGSIEDARIDISSISSAVFSEVVKSIRRGQGILIKYRSMNQPAGVVRSVFPHALVRVSRRWHMRAWCATRNEFRDFTLGRINSIERLEESAPKLREDDHDWNFTEQISVVAHPALTLEQQEMIQQEYFPQAAGRRLVLRKCLVDYIMRDLHIATDTERQLPPEYQLAVVRGPIK